MCSGKVVTVQINLYLVTVLCRNVVTFFGWNLGRRKVEVLQHFSAYQPVQDQP
jgi:hypothetical protein